MLLVLVIILMLIWASIVGTIYSNFLVFYSNFSEGENYHKAYYSAISALERGELVVKQRGPWYVWSGGFILWEWKGSSPDNTNWWSDRNLTWFSYLWDNSRPSSIFRTITSRATRIPAEWQWNVERMLSASDSNNYNVMNYEDSEIFLLYYDLAKNNPYKKVDCKNWNDCTNSSPTDIDWLIRLPKKLISTDWWNNLDTSNPLTKLKNEAPADDPIIDRQVRWYYSNYPFTVYSSQSESNKYVIYPDDTVIRESDINNVQNNWVKIDVSSNNNWKVFSDNYHWKNKPVTIISQIENTVKGIWWIKNLIWNAQEPQIRFSLLNLLKWSSNNSSWHIYPFLEYYIDFQTIVPDRFYKINAEWNFADYKINLIVHKPTVKETVLGNFTSIFGR